MSGYFKNTLVIDFTVVPARPKLERIREFVFEQMGIEMFQIKNLQTRIIKAQVVIEVESAELAEELASNHNLQHSVEHEGQQYPIPVYTADNIKEIRVFDLPCQMPNTVIAKHLTSFGEVISIKNDIWKDVFAGVANGTRLVRMKLEKPIPSYVMMSGVMAFVTYSSQTRTCKYCSLPLHIGKPCSQNRKDLLSSGLTAAQLLQFPALGKQSTSGQNARSEPAPNPGAVTGDDIPVGTDAHHGSTPSNHPEELPELDPANDVSDPGEVNRESSIDEDGDTQDDFIISDEENQHREQRSTQEQEDTQQNHSSAANQKTEFHTANHERAREISASQPSLHKTTSEPRQPRPRDGSSGSVRGRSSATSSGKRHGSPKLNDSKRKPRQQK